MSKITINLPELNEKEVYELYFRLMNITRGKEMRLTEQQIELSSLIAEKPMDYFLDSQKAPSGKSKKYELAQRLKIKEAGIYEPLKSLIEKKVLEQDTEHGFIGFTNGINSTRSIIKKNLKENKEFKFDYVFNITCKNETSGT